MSRGATATLARLYATWLRRVEWGLAITLTIGVVLGALVVALDRTLNLKIGDTAALQTVTWAATFYLCLVGGIIATRRNAHIGVDIVLPRLKRPVRLRVQGVLLVGSAVVTMLIAVYAWDYVARIVLPHARLISGAQSEIWSLQAWRWPIGLCFAWMSVHFAVGGVVRLLGREPAEVGLAEPRSSALAPEATPLPTETPS